MFGRRRRDGFDADRPAMQNNLDLTGYSEQYVLPADGGFSNRPPREAVPETDLFVCRRNGTPHGVRASQL